jgi:hypothetical protein
VEELFGGLAISFSQLLHNLEHHCGCTVRKLAEWGEILDTDKSTATIYEVVRMDGYAEWYAHIEVYSYDLPVLPDLLRSICLQLDLPQDKVLGKRTH